MDRQQLRKQVELLRLKGETIRAIAHELGVPKSNVHRAVKALSRRAAYNASGSVLFDNETSFNAASAGGFGRPSSGVSNMDRPFVGRIQEMAQLSDALEKSIAGQPHLMMLVGEPGIGKTRLSHEIASYALSGGSQCFAAVATRIWVPRPIGPGYRLSCLMSENVTRSGCDPRWEPALPISPRSFPTSGQYFQV